MVDVQAAQPRSEALDVTSLGRFVARLPDLVSDVSRATTRSDATFRIARSFVFALGACTARVYLVGGDERTLHLAAAENVEASTLARLAVISFDDEFPAAIAARSGVVQRVDGDDPLTFGDANGAGGVAVALPLFAGLRTVGAVIAGFRELTPRDCTELESLSHSLGALVDRARLEDEVQRLRASLQLRERQSAMIVHDLKQPLTSVILSAGHLARTSNSGALPFVERIRTCATHLERMFSDLHDTSLLESGKTSLVLAETDVVELVSTAVRDHVPPAAIVVQGDIPHLAIDAQRVEQVLGNILINAKKYGREASPPCVDISLHDGRVVISVTSEGEPIPVEERAHLFDAHYRGEAGGTRGTGLGLGLYICKKLVEEHGGRIWIEEAEPGNRFSFSLPLSTSASTAMAMSQGPPMRRPFVDEAWTLDEGT